LPGQAKEKPKIPGMQQETATVKLSQKMDKT
jgi:hypothetical protein